MALKFADRVAESTVTVGTGDIFLAGAIDTDHDAFANQFADTETMPVTVFGGGKWMSMEARYNAGANSLTRINFRDSSTGSPISLSGTMTVICGWGAADAALMAAGVAAAIRTDGAQTFNGTQKNQALANVGGVGTDAAQSLSTAQQGLALRNIGAAQTPLINGKIVESHASNAATFAVKTFAGTDPSSSDPVTVIFGDGTQRAITAALSVTLSSGSTAGFSNGVAGRLWFPVIDDAGTLRLGVRNCSNATGVYGFPGNGVLSSTAEGGSGGATSVATTYTGTAVAGKNFVIVAFAEYDTGLVTAGAWNVSPSRVLSFDGQMKKPGDVLKTKIFSTAAPASTASPSPTSTSLSDSIILDSACNLVRMKCNASISNDGSFNFCVGQVFRASTVVGNSGVIGYTAGSGPAAAATVPIRGLDKPNASGSAGYTFKINNTNGSATVGFTGGLLELEEIMG